MSTPARFEVIVPEKKAIILYKELFSEVPEEEIREFIANLSTNLKDLEDFQGNFSYGLDPFKYYSETTLSIQCIASSFYKNFSTTYLKVRALEEVERFLYYGLANFISTSNFIIDLKCLKVFMENLV